MSESKKNRLVRQGLKKVIQAWVSALIKANSGKGSKFSFENENHTVTVTITVTTNKPDNGDTQPSE